MKKKTMKISGLSSLSNKLRSLPEVVRQEVAKGVSASALMLQNDMRMSIQKGPKTGRAYKRGKTKWHRASAPGEAPATDSGRLASHINFTLSERGMKASVGVNDATNIVYAARMEFGGKDSRGVYIAPRPYIRPALRRKAQDIVLRLKKSYKAGIRRVTSGR